MVNDKKKKLTFTYHSLCAKCCSQPFTGLPCSSNNKESACNAGDQGLIPGLGGSSGEGYGNPFQYSCLENSMDGEFHGQGSLGRLQSVQLQRVRHNWVTSTQMLFSALHILFSLHNNSMRYLGLFLSPLPLRKMRHREVKWIVSVHHHPVRRPRFDPGPLESVIWALAFYKLSHVWLFATPWSPPGSSVHGISQARILEQVAIAYLNLHLLHLQVNSLPLRHLGSPSLRSYSLWNIATSSSIFYPNVLNWVL